MTLFIEKKQRFSNSILWTAQREYYDTEGIKAWASDVPFYITSNPFIADSYAHIAIRFIQDWLLKNPKALNETFYFLELGAGPGQFSYYFLKSLSEMQNKLGMHSLKLRYIMSDVAHKNINFWMQHEKLQPYIEAGILDFAQLDLERDAELHLQCSGVSLKKGSIKNPLIVVANYIFDTLRTDIFTVKNNKLYESLISLKTEKSNLKDNKPKKWEKVKVSHTDVAIQNHYYRDAHYNEVLETYRNTLKETHFLFPIATLDALGRLKHIANNKLLLLASDKAFSTMEEQDELDYPELDFHGSFSVMANFDAIARVFKSTGGDALLQTPREGISTGVFASGFQFSALPETRLALDQYVENFSPGDYFVLHDVVCNVNKNVKLEVYAAALSLSRWDPYVYELLADRMIDLLSKASQDTLEYLLHNMPNVAKNFYFVPGCEDILFNIALFFHEAEKYEEAIAYYQKSLSVFGDQHVTAYNLAICYYELKNLNEALSFFKRALDLSPRDKDTKKWIKMIA